MQKAGISHFRKCRVTQNVGKTIYTSSGKSLSVLNTAVDFGRFHFPVLTQATETARAILNYLKEASTSWISLPPLWEFLQGTAQAEICQKTMFGISE